MSSRLYCPFCGGFGQRLDTTDSDDNIIDSRMHCKPCGYTINLKHWNTRAKASEQPVDCLAAFEEWERKNYLGGLGGGRAMALKAWQAAWDANLPTADDVRGIMAPERESGWQPIETAPKGSRVLVGCFNGHGGWLQAIAKIEANPGSRKPRIIHDDMSGPDEKYVTHWAPLPNPLSNESEGDKS